MNLPGGTLREWLRDGAAGAALALIPGLMVMASIVGCADPLKIPQTVNVAVPTPCIAPQDKPQRPALLSDAELLALDTYRAVWALWGDRIERQGYELTLEAIVDGCSRIQPIKP